MVLLVAADHQQAAHVFRLSSPRAGGAPGSLLLPLHCNHEGEIQHNPNISADPSTCGMTHAAGRISTVLLSAYAGNSSSACMLSKLTLFRTRCVVVQSIRASLSPLLTVLDSLLSI